MSASAITASKEVAEKIRALIAKGVRSLEVQALAEHVYLGGERIVVQPVAVENKGKSIVIFEHYRAERDENEGLKLSIKYSRADSAESKFEPYSYNVNDWMNRENIEEIGTRLGSYKWVFDIPLDSSWDRYGSFGEKGRVYGARLDYIELAYIIKMAEYLNILHYVDHDFLMFMSKYELEMQKKGTLKFLELKQAFLELFEIVYEYLGEKYPLYQYDGYWNYQVDMELKKKLKSICSTRFKFLFNTLTQEVDMWRGNKVKRVLRISEIVSFSEWFSPYMQRVKELEKYSKAQLFYLLVFQDDVKQFNNLNFFSHKNMISKEVEDGVFKFPNKRALKNFNKMNVEILEKFFASYQKDNFLKDWWFSEKQKFFAEDSLYQQNSKINLNKFNFMVWLLLMAWLTQGEYPIKLKNQKYDNDKIRIIAEMIQCIHRQKPILTGNGLMYKHDIGSSQVVNLDKIVLAFDFCCKYLDHISEDLKVDEKALGLAVKKVKEHFKNKFPQKDINRQLRKEMEKKLEEKVRIYDQKREAFRDYITHRDEHCHTYVNMQSISRTTTFKSLERKIERWHEDLNTYTAEELEEAKLVKYEHLKPNKIEYMGGVFEPITNKCELMIEGAEMRHCIASFNYMVLREQYIVFKVKRKEERATLGVVIIKGGDNKFEFAQCYKKYNHLVSSEMNTLAQDFVVHLNKHPKLILSHTT